MRNKILFALLALMMAGLFFGCVTFPEPKDDTDTLFIIPIRNEYEASKEENLFGKYFIRIVNMETKKQVKALALPLNRDYIIVDDLPPGRYNIADSFFRYERTGEKVERDDFRGVSLNFTLKPGTMKILPYAFGNRIYTGKGGRTYMNFNFIWNRREEIFQETLDLLEKKHPEQVASWEIAPL